MTQAETRASASVPTILIIELEATLTNVRVSAFVD